MARAQLADRRGDHVHGRTSHRRHPGPGRFVDFETSESAAVTAEYADVLDMFRQLRQMSEGSAEYNEQRDRIIERCLPLADHITRRFEGKGEARDDLLQVARIGLINAVRRFDVEMGADFPSFAVPTIMGEVRRHFRDNSWSVKVPRRIKDLHVRIGTATGEMSQRLGRAPTASELAAELDVDREEVLDGLMAASSYKTASIDGAMGGDEESPPLAETLGDVDPGLETVEYRETLRPLLAELPERERTVLVLRFFESMTQSQIAEKLGISQMHVSRLLAKTLAQLRDKLQ
ncbi:SigB/SigF/SigG family RNA polymerase sigma factor [Mycobacterium sp. CBMA226]|nr:SigB/SigF/SigG family RNA polymerase sigma factor [Mycolicibacterium sp. CBMA 226]